MPNGCTSVGSFLRPAILVPPAGTKRVRCWGLEPGDPRSTSSSAEPLTDGHRVVSVATASGNLPRLVPILTAWPRLPPTLAQPVCCSSSSVMGGRLREAAGPSLAGGRGQHLSHSSVSLAGMLGGGCPWDPTVDSSLMLLMFQEEKTQHLECCREGRQGARRILGILSRAGLRVSRRRLWRPAVQAWHWGPHPYPCFPPPSCVAFPFLPPPALYLRSAAYLGTVRRLGGDRFLDSFGTKTSLMTNIDHPQSAQAFQPLPRAEK